MIEAFGKSGIAAYRFEKRSLTFNYDKNFFYAPITYTVIGRYIYDKTNF